MSRSIAPLVVSWVVACAPATPSPRSSAERAARCESRAAPRIVRAPKSVGRWQHYELPAWWAPERRELVIAYLLDGVGRPLLRDGSIDEVVIDHATGALDVHADGPGHEEVVRRLGGCVLYPDPPCEDCVLEVVALEHARADGVQRALAALPALDVRVVVDEATNSLVLLGRAERTARARALAVVLDCKAE
ncbi:MAG: hypothetical protein ACXWUE_05950 [Polyangiales bacterium]